MLYTCLRFFYDKRLINFSFILFIRLSGMKNSAADQNHRKNNKFSQFSILFFIIISKKFFFSKYILWNLNLQSCFLKSPLKFLLTVNLSLCYIRHAYLFYKKRFIDLKTFLRRFFVFLYEFLLCGQLWLLRVNLPPKLLVLLPKNLNEIKSSAHHRQTKISIFELSKNITRNKSVNLCSRNFCVTLCFEDLWIISCFLWQWVAIVQLLLT